MTRSEFCELMAAVHLRNAEDLWALADRQDVSKDKMDQDAAIITRVLAAQEMGLSRTFREIAKEQPE